MGFLEEIAAKLEALGLGTQEVDLFVGKRPATPEECCVVYEYPGGPPEFGLGTAGIRFETRGLQVMFRGPLPGPGVTTAYTGPRAKAEAAYHGLAAVQAETLSAGVGGTSAFYHWIHPQQTPFPLGGEEDERVLIACNFLCKKEPSA